MFTLVDHHLNLEPFWPDDWKIVGQVSDALGAVEIRRNARGFWCKGRPRRPLYHLQSIHQIWDLYIQAGTLPPQELVEDTNNDRKRRAEEETARQTSSMPYDKTTHTPDTAPEKPTTSPKRSRKK